MKQFSKFKKALLSAALATSMLPVFAHAQVNEANTGASAPTWTTPSRAEPPPPDEQTYEDNFTFKWHKAFNHDPWIWGYTQEFAERFKMPIKWVEPELKGALAVAFRMSTLGRTTCGLSGKEDNCWPPLKCQLDIYFDSKTPLPWKNPSIQQDSFIKELHSGQNLDWPTVNRQTLEKYPRGGGSGNTGLDFGLDVYGPKGLRRAPGAFVVYYDKAFRPGVMLVSWEGPALCPAPIGRAEMNFRTWDVTEQIMYGRIKREDAPFMHQVQIPESYVRRANVIYERENKPNQEVVQRLLRNFQDGRQSQ